MFIYYYLTCAITITWEKPPMAHTHVPMKSLTQLCIIFDVLVIWIFSMNEGLQYLFVLHAYYQITTSQIIILFPNPWQLKRLVLIMMKCVVMGNIFVHMYAKCGSCKEKQTKSSRILSYKGPIISCSGLMNCMESYIVD